MTKGIYLHQEKGSIKMYLIIQAIIIGIVEGITEFLPISSTGHMIIVGHLINFKGPFANLFEVVIQLGAILAIVVLYREKIFGSLSKLAPGQSGFKFWLNIFLAFLPSAIAGFLLKDFIEEHLFNTFTVSLGLIVGGILLYFMENKYRGRNHLNNVDYIHPWQALQIGCFQCLALWPGMSRSSSTIIGAWISGLSNVAAAEFSFFLAIPTMVAASGFSLLKTRVALSSPEIVALIVGFVVSFIVALLVVEGFIGFLKKKPMRVFAFYRIVVGFIFLGLSLSHLLNL